MYKFRLVSLFVFITLPFTGLGQVSQNDLEIPINHRVIINYLDHVVYANIMTIEKEIEPDLELYYFWYSSNDIKKTRGGYDGTLLHGTYMEFYSNKDLKQKGCFRYGVKHDLWKTWYPSGELASITNWKKGKMKGDFKIFSKNGELIKEGCYKNNLLHGKIRTYLPSGEVEVCKFKNGKKKIKKEGFFRKLFRRIKENKEKNDKEEEENENGKKEEAEDKNVQQVAEGSKN